MYRIVFAAFLLAPLVAACSMVPSDGPLRSQLVDQAGDDGQRRFDIVNIDDRVIETLLAQPQPPFRARFKKYLPPPELPIAIGDMVTVTIWESTENGLYGRSLHASLPTAEQFAARLRAARIPVPRGPLSPTQQKDLLAKLERTPIGQVILQSLQPSGRSGTGVPSQPVGPDGAISIPYGGRVRVAGVTPSAAQRMIEHILLGKAIDPQVLVRVTSSDANAVTVTGELVDGGRVPLSPHGSRLLEIIAAAGGAKAPVRDTFVQLSRDGVTATIPLATLVAEPDEDIFAKPGDVLTLVGRPQVVSVFGATGKNAAVTFNADRVYLSEALAKGGGLADDRADPSAVFLLRYENAAVVRALGEPSVSGAGNGVEPVAYRLDLSDARSYALARRFPMRDKDVVYVANASSTPLQKVMTVFSNLTAPVVNYYALCNSGTVKC